MIGPRVRIGMAAGAVTILLATVAACGSTTGGSAVAAIAGSQSAGLPSELTDIPGLSDLTNIPGLSELTNIPGLSDLTNIPGLTDIPELSDLTDIPELSELTNIPELSELTDIPELSGLTDIPGLSGPCLPISFALIGIGFGMIPPFTDTDTYDATPVLDSINGITTVPDELKPAFQTLTDAANAADGKNGTDATPILTNDKVTGALDDISNWLDGNCG